MRIAIVPLLMAVALGPVVFSPPAQATATDLAFATYNVCKTDCAAPAPSWDVRRERVARTINESGVDVLGLQEATWQPTANAKTQWQDLANLVSAGGYVSPVFSQGSQECAWTKENPHKCTHTAALFFRSSTVEQVTTPNGTPSAGVTNEGTIVAGLDADSASREVAWAYLRGRSGTAPFLALSVHTSTDKDPTHEASRVLFANTVTAWVQAMNNTHGLPGAAVVLMADLNSYVARQPQGAQSVLYTGGWVDAAAAPDRRNYRFSTINYNPVSGDSGFPVKPYQFNRDATRIDYVLALGPAVPVAYEVVMHVKADGSFDEAYQGSDHQMVRAVVSLLPAQAGVGRSAG
ncbi:MAG: endonuclease/exonuclease/phosphatase family protein [Actinomycetes bacterium]